MVHDRKDLKKIMHFSDLPWGTQIKVSPETLYSKTESSYTLYGN